MDQAHGFVDAELHEVLGIPEDVVIAATVTLGVPEGRHGPVRRLPLRDVVYDDVWEGDAPWTVDPPDARFTRAGPSREATPR